MGKTIGDHGYFPMAFQPDKLIECAEKNLKGIEFDTFVGTGLSGGLVVPLMAWHFKKFAYIIRKQGERAHSTNHQGTLGENWIFVDDKICSGDTRQRVFNAIELTVSKYKPMRPDFSTTYLGTYLYQEGRYVYSRSGEPNFPGYNEGRFTLL